MTELHKAYIYKSRKIARLQIRASDGVWMQSELVMKHSLLLKGKASIDPLETLFEHGPSRLDVRAAKDILRTLPRHWKLTLHGIIAAGEYTLPERYRPPTERLVALGLGMLPDYPLFSNEWIDAPNKQVLDTVSNAVTRLLDPKTPALSRGFYEAALAQAISLAPSVREARLEQMFQPGEILNKSIVEQELPGFPNLTEDLPTYLDEFELVLEAAGFLNMRDEALRQSVAADLENLLDYSIKPLTTPLTSLGDLRKKRLRIAEARDLTEVLSKRSRWATNCLADIERTVEPALQYLEEQLAPQIQLSSEAGYREAQLVEEKLRKAAGMLIIETAPTYVAPIVLDKEPVGITAMVPAPTAALITVPAPKLADAEYVEAEVVDAEPVIAERAPVLAIAEPEKARAPRRTGLARKLAVLGKAAAVFLVAGATALGAYFSTRSPPEKARVEFVEPITVVAMAPAQSDVETVNMPIEPILASYMCSQPILVEPDIEVEVVKGDTLSQITEQHMLDNDIRTQGTTTERKQSFWEIVKGTAAYNKLTNPRLIFSGQTIRFPGLRRAEPEQRSVLLAENLPKEGPEVLGFEPEVSVAQVDIDVAPEVAKRATAPDYVLPPRRKVGGGGPFTVVEAPGPSVEHVTIKKKIKVPTGAIPGVNEKPPKESYLRKNNGIEPNSETQTVYSAMQAFRYVAEGRDEKAYMWKDRLPKAQEMLLKLYEMGPTQESAQEIIEIRTAMYASYRKNERKKLESKVTQRKLPASVLQTKLEPQNNDLGYNLTTQERRANSEISGLEELAKGNEYNGEIVWGLNERLERVTCEYEGMLARNELNEEQNGRGRKAVQLVEERILGKKWRKDPKGLTRGDYVAKYSQHPLLRAA